MHNLIHPLVQFLAQYAEDIPTGVLTILGGIVAAYPPEKKQRMLKLFYICSFALFGLLGVATGRSAREQSKDEVFGYYTQSQHSQRTFSKDLSSVREQDAYIKQQSTASLNFLSVLSKTLSPEQFRAAVQQVVAEQSAINQGAPQPSNEELRQETTRYTKAIRDLGTKHDRAFRDLLIPRRMDTRPVEVRRAEIQQLNVPRPRIFLDTEL